MNKRERNEGQTKEHRQVSDICADSAPVAALSNDPDSVVPGRDYPTTQLSTLKSVMRRWDGGDERLREGLDSDKVERGTDSDMKGRVNVTAVGMEWVSNFFCHWVSDQECRAGWQTPKIPKGAVDTNTRNTVHTYTHSSPTPCRQVPILLHHHHHHHTSPVNTPPSAIPFTFPCVHSS